MKWFNPSENVYRRFDRDFPPFSVLNSEYTHNNIFYDHAKNAFVFKSKKYYDDQANFSDLIHQYIPSNYLADVIIKFVDDRRLCLYSESKVSDALKQHHLFPHIFESVKRSRL